MELGSAINANRTLSVSQGVTYETRVEFVHSKGIYLSHRQIASGLSKAVISM